MQESRNRKARGKVGRALGIVLVGWVGLATAGLPPHDENGGHTLTVSFDLPTLLESGYLDVDGFTEERYCSIFEKLSWHLWQTTEGNHWVRRVDFRLGVTESNINWFFRPESTTSYGGFKNSIVLNENYGSSKSPVNDGETDPVKLEEFDEALAWLLDHEIGHFVYGLSDEYNHGRERGAQLGLCSGYTGGTCKLDSAIVCNADAVCDEANPGDTCDKLDKQSCEDDDDCTGGESCIQQEVRKGGADFPSKICNDHSEDSVPGSFTLCEDDADCAGLEDPFGNDAVCVDDKITFLCAGVSETTHCWTDEHCQQDGEPGWCVREGQGGQAASRRICREPNPVSPPFPSEAVESGWRNLTSNMASSGGGGRWCDETTHRLTRVIQRGKGGAFDEEGTTGDPEYTLGLAQDYTTWDRAARTELPADDAEVAHPDLRSYFDARTPGDYPPWSALDYLDFLAATDFDTEYDCNWFIDEIPQPGDNTMIIVDKSGSMDYEIGTGAFKKTAFEWAAEGSLIAMEHTADANWVGILAFADDASTELIQPFVERGGIDIAEDPFDTFFDGVEAGGSTDIGHAIGEAVAEMQGLGPAGNRNIILMSDGANTVTSGPSPLEAAIEACEAGIRVNTIAFGNAEISALKELADACDGLAVAAGNEADTVVGDDAHLLKGEFVRMKLNVEGLDQIFRQVLGTLSNSQDVITKEFFVPEVSGALVFSWIGNEVPYCAEFSSGEHCVDFTDVWSELGFTLESPSGELFNGTIGEAFHTASSVVGPEAGWWKAHVDASGVPTNAYTELRERTRVIWLAHVDNRDLFARAWVDNWMAGTHDPVVINASMTFQAPLTKVVTVAEVQHNGITYAPVVLFDDGAHNDGDPGDAIYGGTFNPTGTLITLPGAYSVKVRFLAIEGIARTVTLEGGPEDEDAPARRAASAFIEADTSFHLDGRHDCTALVCPDPRNPARLDLPLGSLPQGSGPHGPIVATVTDLPLSPGRVGIDLGPGVHVSNLRIATNPPSPGGPPGGQVYFDVEVDPDAPVGPHPATVWVGTRKATASFDVTCGETDLAAPTIEAGPLSLQACGGLSAVVLLPLPPISDCSTARLQLDGWLVRTNGTEIVPPSPIDTSNPQVDLPFGESWVRWEASDGFGNRTVYHQRIRLRRDGACALPTRVPDGATTPGRPLRLAKLPGGSTRLSWGTSCAGDDDYAVFEGTLREFDSHAPLTCSTGGATEIELSSRAPASVYYLIVPVRADVEGSYGLGVHGSERQPSEASCGVQLIGQCPSF